jgi:hypothetical protein
LSVIPQKLWKKWDYWVGKNIFLPTGRQARFYNCGLLEGKGNKAFVGNEYYENLSLWAVNAIR